MQANLLLFNTEKEDTAFFRKAMLMISVSFGLFLAWSILSEISSAVTVPGQISTVGQTKVIKSVDSGKVTVLNIANGISVTQGDTLIQLDSSENQANLDALTSQKEKLLFEVSIYQSLMNYGTPNAINKGAKTGEDTPLNRNKFQEILEQLNAKDISHLSVLDRRIDVLSQQKESLDKERTSNSSQIEVYFSELEDLQYLFEKGLVANNRIYNVKINLARLQGRNEIISSDILGIQKEILRTNAEKTAYINTKQADTVQRIMTVQDKILSLDVSIAAQREAIRAKSILAPTSGIITNVNVLGEGVYVLSGEVLLEIVPNNSKLEFFGVLPSTAIDSVFQGQTAFIQPSTTNLSNEKQLKAIVISIGADKRFDDASKTEFYDVRIAIQDLPEQRSIIERLGTGMPAEAFIEVRKQSPISFLLQPLARSFRKSWRAG